MNKRIIHDSSNLIWFDFNNLDIDVLDNSAISTFDITNMPVDFVGYDIINRPKYSPKHFELDNYYVTFFADSKSKTGYSCMCINKDRSIYKSKAGYINDKPEKDEY